MQKKVIIALGLVALMVLSYVGIAQLNNIQKDMKDVKSEEATKSALAETEKALDKSEEEEEEEKMAELLENSSGLKYRIEKHGTGDTSPKPGQLVTVHYTGWFDDNGNLGKKFDSSVDRGQPFSFAIGRGQVIKGWDEGVLSMRKGEKRHLIVPPDLGYGPNGYPGVIPGNATLHFDVELIDFK